MKIAEYASFDAMALAELVRRREVTPAELAAAAFTAIEQVNPRLNAVVDVFRAEAEAAIAAGLPDGPFKGVPFLIKDLALMYAGKPTRMGSRLYKDFVAPFDSELMARYRRAGLVTIGKTNVPEFGLSFATESVLYGPARNPWDPERSPSGSSGGAAAAVAARIVPAAHANDAGGSIRVPASVCALFGLKPSRARTPAGPMAGEQAFGLGVEHALTRSVRDSAALLDAVAGEDPGAPYTAVPPARPFLQEVTTPPGRLRIAFTDEAWNGAPVSAECKEGARRAARLCEELGHEIVPASPAIEWKHFRTAAHLLTAFTAHAMDVLCPMFGLVPSPENVEAATLAIAAQGRRMSAIDLVSSFGARDMLTRAVGQFFTQYDILLTPTQAAPPAPIGTFKVNEPGLTADEIYDRLFAFGAFTPLFNVSGNPAMSVPLHFTDEGLPIGVQFVARSGQEATLFRLAGQLEGAAPWANRAPPISVK
ncbi:amidase [Polyangium aurulentum]|uniref:amidase n=1 Tax=Polyangium aurulentum TaxID=2567896 RepID=UPI0010ADEEAC|nr:amidase [Polyangium aurulentum]UQA63360.1 amidase [Polyangium aurulentum]